MIGYIVISYMIMFVICFYYIVFDGEDFKPNFKWWVFSPITLPLMVLSKFVSW